MKAIRKKLKLAIVSEKTRHHFQAPLSYLKHFEITHFYKSVFSDMNPSGFTGIIRYKNAGDLIEKLSKTKPDLVQGLEPYYGYSRLRIPVKVLPILWATYRFCRKTKTPYFFHVLENIEPTKKYGFFAGLIMRKIARIYAKDAKFIFYLNEGAKKNLLELGVKDKISFALWGVWGADKDIFFPAKTKREDLKLLFVGRLIAMKGVEDLVEAMKAVVKEVPRAELTIVGTGPLKKILFERAKQLKIEKNIKFAGEAASSGMPAIYRRATVLISPSRSLRYSSEQVGMVNIEAMMSGLPVISTRSGSIGEFVEDGRSGILVPEGNPEELAGAIIKICKNKSLREKLSENARISALEKYDARKNVELLEETVLAKSVLRYN